MLTCLGESAFLDVVACLERGSIKKEPTATIYRSQISRAMVPAVARDQNHGQLYLVSSALAHRINVLAGATNGPAFAGDGGALITNELTTTVPAPSAINHLPSPFSRPAECCPFPFRTPALKFDHESYLLYLSARRPPSSSLHISHLSPNPSSSILHSTHHTRKLLSTSSSLSYTYT